MFPSDVMKATKSKWYKCIRPSITPPNIVFPIVWSVLYVTIALALAQVLMLDDSNMKGRVDKFKLISFFIVNLVLNILWSLMFFGVNDVTFAFVIIIGIIMSQIMVLVYSWKLLPRWAFWIQIPYICWLCFACLLNGLSMTNIRRCIPSL